ncbi:MAG: FGGY family carbohydrate kinase [Elusimicrobia bacterium]|nr:FGGY family carbohydrate kinase [Elusimicrobiota bacterium]
MKGFVAAVDCGTSAVKAAVFDLAGQVKGSSRMDCPCRFLRDGRIEQSPRLIVERTFSCLKEAVERSGVKAGQISSLAISNQRATVICADHRGEAIGDAVSWQDMRGGRALRALRRRISDAEYYGITGLPNNPVFSLGKILSFKNTPQHKKTCRFVLVQDYLLKQFGADGFFLDWSNASLTGMFEVERFRWSAEILKLAGVSESQLSTLVASGQKVGAVSRRAARCCGLLPGTPLVSGGGDQQCAGLGAGAVRAGVAELTLGTAGVLLACVERPRKDPKMRVTCCAHAVPGKWEVEGLQNAAGSCLDWLGRIASGKRFSRGFWRRVCAAEPGLQDPLFFPFLAGAGAPNWDPEAKAMLLGLTHAHGRASLARSVLEGVCLEAKSILSVFGDMKVPVKEIRLTGGASEIEGWSQMQADIFGIKVSQLANPEASVLGAGMLAACGAGAFESLPEAADAMVKSRRTCKPAPENTRLYARRYQRYLDILGRFESHGIFHLMSGSESA